MDFPRPAVLRSRILINQASRETLLRKENRIFHSEKPADKHTFVPLHLQQSGIRFVSFRQLWTAACRENPMFGYINGRSENGYRMHRQRDYNPRPLRDTCHRSSESVRYSALIHHTTSCWFFDGIIMTHSRDLIFPWRFKKKRKSTYRIVSTTRRKKVDYKTIQIYHCVIFKMETAAGGGMGWGKKKVIERLGKKTLYIIREFYFLKKLK